MDSIFINKENSDLSGQLSFLIRREFINLFDRFKPGLFFVLIWFVGVTVLWLAFPGDSLVTIKAMTTAFSGFVLLIAFILFVVQLLKFVRRKIWKQKIVRTLVGNAGKYKLYFDLEVIRIRGSGYLYEWSWQHYQYWAVHKNSIFIIPQKDLYASIFLSIHELGTPDFNRLKDIASKRLLPLPGS